MDMPYNHVEQGWQCPICKKGVNMRFLEFIWRIFKTGLAVYIGVPLVFIGLIILMFIIF